MQNCNKCGIETELYCSKCRIEISSKYKNLIPLLFWDKENKVYHFGCNVISCPCNNGLGICGIKHIKLPNYLFLHEFDGDNIIKQICG